MELFKPFLTYHIVRFVLLIFICLLASASNKAYSLTIDFWHPWPHARSSINSLAREYSKSTGIVVRVRVFNPSSYSPWISGSTPDVVGLYRPTKTGVEDMVRRGRVYKITSDMQRGRYARFSPGLLDTFRVRQDIYGVPLTGQVHLFVYNKDLFKRAGITAPPRTWSELMAVSSRLRGIGVIPYAGGFGSNRPPLAHAYEWSYLGLHNLMQTYNGHRPYTSSDWVRYLGIYQEMRRYGFTNSNSAKTSEATAIKAMLDGRVAMVFVGPGFESIRGAYKPKFTSWGLFTVPVDSRARFLPRMPGGVEEGVVINQRSRNKAQAVRFARWLTEPRQQIIIANGASSIPANSSVNSHSGIRPHLRAFAIGMRDQSVDLRVYERPQVLTTFYTGVRNLLGGFGSPSSVARSTNTVKRR